ncbi:MAG: ELM1/GtrOC1 family putative glycosyltransferase [Methylophilaceae bacterium]
MKKEQKQSIVIWRFMDGKVGHEKQSLALIYELSQKINCLVSDIDLPKRHNIFYTLFFLKFLELTKLKKPDLIIGIGHMTHSYVFFSKKYFGGKSILIMRPSLPIRWFDLCIVPEHDVFGDKASLFVTQGPLVGEKKIKKKIPKSNLILIGGHSKHFNWDSQLVISQIKNIIFRNPKENYILTTSRRTPKNFILDLKKYNLNNLKIFSYENTNPDWINKALSDTLCAWVTKDSYSMIYEAWFAGARVGIINLPNEKESRLLKAINQLLIEKKIFLFNEKEKYLNFKKPKSDFNEAKRCAEFIYKKFLF